MGRSPKKAGDRPAGHSHQWLPAGLRWPRGASGGSQPAVHGCTPIRSLVSLALTRLAGKQPRWEIVTSAQVLE